MLLYLGKGTKNNVSSTKQKYRNYTMACLIAITLLFFFPWLSSNMNSSVLASDNVIKGSDLKNYSETLSALAGKNVGMMIQIGLKATNYFFIAPIFAFLSAIILLIRKKTGYICAIIALTIHILIGFAFILIPSELKELIDLLFVIQPTVYLYSIIGIIGVIYSVKGLILLKNEEKFSQRGTNYMNESAAWVDVEEQTPIEPKKSKPSRKKKTPPKEKVLKEKKPKKQKTAKAKPKKKEKEKTKPKKKVSVSKRK